jgi:hypothetical protein
LAAESLSSGGNFADGHVKEHPKGAKIFSEKISDLPTTEGNTSKEDTQTSKKKSPSKAYEELKTVDNEVEKRDTSKTTSINEKPQSKPKEKEVKVEKKGETPPHSHQSHHHHPDRHVPQPLETPHSSGAPGPTGELI